MKELMYIRSFSKRRLPVIVGTLLLVIIGSVWLNMAPFRSGFDIADELGGNIFPSSILSVATTDAQVIVPVDSMYVGNPKSCIAVRVRSRNAYSRVRVEVAETPFFSRSVSEFVLAKPRTEYIIYPDIIWNYEALKNNNQAEPISVAVMVEMNGKDLGQRVRTFSVMSPVRCASISTPWALNTSSTSGSRARTNMPTASITISQSPGAWRTRRSCWSKSSRKQHSND